MGPRQLESLSTWLAEMSLHGVRHEPARVADAWRAAAAVYRQLESSEAGAADHAPIKPLPRAMQTHVAALAALPAVRATFDSVPIAFGMVALGSLIVSQYTLTCSKVDALCRNRLTTRQPRAIAALCLPLAPGTAQFALVSQDSREFVFASDAHDMRFLAAQVHAAAAPIAAAMPGHAQALLALGVGFSTNVLDVIRFKNRTVLNNGHHRAHALHRMGITHVPCLIQACGDEADNGADGDAEA